MQECAVEEFPEITILRCGIDNELYPDIPDLKKMIRTAGYLEKHVLGKQDAELRLKFANGLRDVIVETLLSNINMFDNGETLTEDACKALRHLSGKGGLDLNNNLAGRISLSSVIPDDEGYRKSNANITHRNNTDESDTDDETSLTTEDVADLIDFLEFDDDFLQGNYAGKIRECEELSNVVKPPPIDTYNDNYQEPISTSLTINEFRNEVITRTHKVSIDEVLREKSDRREKKDSVVLTAPCPIYEAFLTWALKNNYHEYLSNVEDPIFIDRLKQRIRDVMTGPNEEKWIARARDFGRHCANYKEYPIHENVNLVRKWSQLDALYFLYDLSGSHAHIYVQTHRRAANHPRRDEVFQEMLCINSRVNEKKRNIYHNDDDDISVKKRIRPDIIGDVIKS